MKCPLTSTLRASALRCFEPSKRTSALETTCIPKSRPSPWQMSTTVWPWRRNTKDAREKRPAAMHSYLSAAIWLWLQWSESPSCTKAKLRTFPRVRISDIVQLNSREQSDVWKEKSPNKSLGDFVVSFSIYLPVNKWPCVAVALLLLLQFLYRLSACSQLCLGLFFTSDPVAPASSVPTYETARPINSTSTTKKADLMAHIVATKCAQNRHRQLRRLSLIKIQAFYSLDTTALGPCREICHTLVEPCSIHRMITILPPISTLTGNLLHRRLTRVDIKGLVVRLNKERVKMEDGVRYGVGKRSEVRNEGSSGGGRSYHAGTSIENSSWSDQIRYSKMRWDN